MPASTSNPSAALPETTPAPIPPASARPAPHLDRSRRLLWPLVALSILLTLGVAALGFYLLTSDHTVAGPAPRQLAVPYALAGDVLDLLRRQIIQEDGREKPFDTFCRESLRTVTGRERFEGTDPVAVVLSWMLLADEDENRATELGDRLNCDWDHHPCILCDFHALREIVYREHRGEDATLTEQDRHGKYIEPALLRHSSEFKKLVRQATVKRMEDGKAALLPVEEKAREVNSRLELYARIRSADAFGLVALDACGKSWFTLHRLRACRRDPGEWQKIMDARRIENPAPYQGKLAQPVPAGEVAEVLDAYQALQQAYRDGWAGHDPAGRRSAETALTTAAESFFETVRRVSNRFHPAGVPDTAALELWFNRTNPFRWAWVLGLLAALLLAVSISTAGRWPRMGRGLYLTGLLAHAGCLAWSVAGFYCRVRISGRPPVSNMYESIIWVSFMTAVFALVLEAIYRRGFIGLAGAHVSSLGFVLADQLPLTFSPALQPLQAVLRSNYWLIIHVLTIVSSYAAFALAWALGNLNLGLTILAPGRRDLVRTLSQYGYRAIQIGVVLLAAGTLLGGFWAAESWGRFWGWDPKEVWALIALLCYVIPLHARFLGWVKDFGLAVCSVVCFASVVMAWYGVNFVLGAGLHSYGFGGGQDAWVYWASLVNIDLVLLAALRFSWRPSPHASLS